MTSGTEIVSHTVTTAAGVCTHLVFLEVEPLLLPLPTPVGEGDEAFATDLELVAGLGDADDGAAGGGKSRG